MGKFTFSREFRNSLVITAVLAFFFTIAIPRLGQFYFADKKYQFVGIEELGARSLNRGHVLTFATGLDRKFFNVSDIKTEVVSVNGKNRSVEISENAVILDGLPLVVGGADKNDTLEYGEEGYSVISQSSFNFQDATVSAPSANDSTSNYSSRRAPSSGITFREIDFRAFSAPDYSINKSDEEILSSVLKNVYLANQYLKAVNLVLVLRELKIVREHAGFSEAVLARDPYKMLERTADEHNSDFNNSIDLSGTFSNTYFPKASGLAYSNTSCINPHYSVLFVTQGGSSLSQELTVASTLAHEVGHIIGMGHDLNTYADLGVSLMTQSTSVFPFGFSAQSIEEQKQFSGDDKQGGACFSARIFAADTDKDGVSDELESQYGADRNDPGSFPSSQLTKAYASWNGFKGQTNVGEILCGDADDNNLTINIRNLNGNILSAKNIGIGKSKELDLIFSDLLPEFTDTYGIVEILANSGTFSGLSNTYAHTGQYGTFNYISKQSFFAGSRFEEKIPFNSYAPFSFPQSSEVLNWLSVANLSADLNDFEILRFSLEGQVVGREFISVPGFGRRDILAEGSTGLSAGSVLVRPAKYQEENVLFHSFISRYYSKPNTGLTGSVIVDGLVGSDVDRAFVLDNDLILTDKQSNTWLEVSNASRVGGEIILTELGESGAGASSRNTIKPYQSIHIPLSREGLKGYKIAATVPYVAIALRYKGERANSTVQRFLPHEYLTANFSGSLNTFLGSSSFLYVVTESLSKESITCSLMQGENLISRDISLVGKLITKVSLEGLFPEARGDSYYKVSCNFKNSVERSAMFIGRTVESKHSSIEAME